MENSSDNNFADFAGRMAADYGDGAFESHGVKVRCCQDGVRNVNCMPNNGGILLFNLYYFLRIDAVRMI